MKKFLVKHKKLLFFFLKLGLTGLALFFVFQKVEFADIYEKLKQVNPWYILLALLCFNVSKIMSTWRVKAFLNTLGHKISLAFNIRLYYIGAFYNLFLPGSIGGDALKVLLLRRTYPDKTGRIVSVVLLDRLSGLVALVIYAVFLLAYSPFDPDWAVYPWLLYVGGILVLPVWYLVLKLIFKAFTGAYWETNLISLVSQGIQILMAFCLLKAIGLDGHYYSYLTLFLVASVVSVLPISIAGLGTRETVFILGAEYFPVEESYGVTFTLLAFTVMAFSSFIGLFFTWNEDFSDLFKKAETVRE